MRSPPRIFLYQLANIKRGTIMAAYIIYFFTGTFSNVNNFNREELYAIFLRASLTDFGDHTSYDNLKCAVYDLTANGDTFDTRISSFFSRQQLLIWKLLIILKNV